MSLPLHIALVFATVLAVSSCRDIPKVSSSNPLLSHVEVDVVRITPQNLPAPFEFIGVLSAFHRVEVRSRVEGVLLENAYQEGQLVQKGDILFQIDPQPYEAKLENSKGDLDAEQSNLWQATQTVNRLKTVFEQKAASRKDFEEAIAQEQIAQAHVNSAKARVKQAELDLSYTVIKAPITGIAGETTYSEGSLIDPSSSKFLTQIETIDPISVNFHISESDVLKQRRDVDKGLLILPPSNEYNIELTLADGTVYPIMGKLDYTSPTFRPETGTISMRATVPNPESLLRPGQFVRANLIGAHRPNAIAIPQRAVLQGSQGMYVYLVKDGKAVRQNVEAGPWYNREWIIDKGLRDGDLVIVDGLDKITSNTPVTVMTTTIP